jgi:phosphoesterase RecJ-like protein
MSEETNMTYEQALARAAEILAGSRRVLILTHRAPDGDTLGSGFALCRALRKLGKSAVVVCSDAFPQKYDYLWRGLGTMDADPDKFDHDLVVSSDIADTGLLGERLAPYAGRITLCIDHHPSNSRFAAFTLLDPAAAANCEIMCDVIHKLGVEIDKDIANCIYTGLATDTGCFRFSNTRAKTLRAAAEMLDCGAATTVINKLLFETVTRSRMAAEAMILSTLEYHCGGRAAFVTVSRETMDKAGVTEEDLEGVPSIAARIEGVLLGVTFKEKEPGIYKISARSSGGVDASALCAGFGGGGHKCAAGCTLEGTLEQVKAEMLATAEKALN